MSAAADLSIRQFRELVSFTMCSGVQAVKCPGILSLQDQMNSNAIAGGRKGLGHLGVERVGLWQKYFGCGHETSLVRKPE